MRLKLLLIVLWAGAVGNAVAQTGARSPDFMEHATIRQKPDGRVLVTASSPRPMLQSLTAIRRRYGWILDYEEGKYGPEQTVLDLDGRSRLRGGFFQVALEAPVSFASVNEASFLQTFIGKAAAATSQKFSLRPTSYGRYTVVTGNGVEPLMLDTAIRLPRASRTIDETIEAILALVSRERGTPLVSGGLVDNGLMSQTVTVGGDDKTAARDLLEEALNATDVARVWSVCYEPSDGNFVIGIEPAIRAETGASGEIRVTPVENPAKVALKH